MITLDSLACVSAIPHGRYGAKFAKLSIVRGFYKNGGTIKACCTAPRIIHVSQMVFTQRVTIISLPIILDNS